MLVHAACCGCAGARHSTLLLLLYSLLCSTLLYSRSRRSVDVKYSYVRAPLRLRYKYYVIFMYLRTYILLPLLWSSRVLLLYPTLE